MNKIITIGLVLFASSLFGQGRYLGRFFYDVEVKYEHNTLRCEHKLTATYKDHTIQEYKYKWFLSTRKAGFHNSWKPLDITTDSTLNVVFPPGDYFVRCVPNAYGLTPYGTNFIGALFGTHAIRIRVMPNIRSEYFKNY